jgi:hypothetical protein
MLSRLADLIRLRPLADDAVPRVSPAGAADLRHLPVGTELQARVTAALPGRVYQVLIGERTYAIPLPIDARPGDELQLTVVERDPQRGPAHAARPAAGPGGAAVTTLSETARFITTLLDPQAQPPAQSPLTGVLRPSAPLLAGPPADTVLVAARLSEALAASGMFYESHQVQWVAGERSLAQLLKEPQARIPPLPEPAGIAADDATAFAAQPGPARVVEAPVHPALLAIVKEQLQTLSSLQLAWHGQVWPGQDLHWEIAEEAPERGAAPGAGGTWQTRLRLRLPRLGDVRATLSVGASGVSIGLAADTTSTADAMNAASASLRAALSTAGLRPAGLRIERRAVARG